MAAFDGQIRIDSKIEGKNFNTGIKSMIASVGKLAVAIASAFAVRAVVQFGKSAVDEASKMASALIGLQSVVEGTGNSFIGAQEFIRSFTADGLVPAADAITAYKNLLLRGYDTSQIETTLKALKDSAAFGRSAHLTLGEAVKTATEGLRNENSILVDNAGVTKNISIIWRDYAESIGTTVAALTKQQKIQAEVLGIMEETKFQTGDAAKLSGTYAGQVSALGVSFLNLKVAIGNVIIPIATRVIPYIRAAIDALVIFFNRLATLMSLFFGVDQNANATADAMGGIADDTNAAADAQEGLADSTKKAEKAAKGALAAFDQLNVLQRPEDEAGVDAPVVALPVIDTVQTDKTLDALALKVEEFKMKLLTLFGPAIAAFERLKKALEPLGEIIRKGLGWAWEHIFKPFGKWAIESFLPRFFDLLAAGGRLLTAALVVLQPVFSWLWENILKPLAGAAGTFILIAIEGWTMAFNDLAAWLEAHPNIFGPVIESATKLWENFTNTWKRIFANLVEVFKAIKDHSAQALSGVIEFIQGVFTGNWALVWQGLKDIAAGVIGVIVDLFRGFVGTLVLLLLGMSNQIKIIWSGIAPWFANNVINPLRNAFGSMIDWLQNRFGSMVNWLRNTFGNAFGDISGAARGSFNALIDVINSLLNRIASAINNMAGIINQFSWMMGGFSIPTVSAPHIPHLATGAVIPPNAQFAAILGDQRSGKNIEAPEGLIRQIMREEMGKIQADIRIEFSGTLGELARQLKPVLDKENIRIGGNLIKGSVSV